MSIKPIKTKRLILRSFKMSDAVSVQKLANDKKIARFTKLPFPYNVGHAEHWIGRHPQMISESATYPFAITLKEGGDLIGAISLMKLDYTAHTGELGYWVGAKYWNNGYCTEAAKGLLGFGFNTLKLNRIHSCHAEPNVGSGRVLQKSGFKKEGVFRQHRMRAGQLVDMIYYGLLASDYTATES